jgi:alginate O-acetyltransferase complex protein AlgI
VTDFWRRWHISLTSWFREYLYIPLGGNRRGTAKALRNILIVWLCTGFWHGAELELPPLGPLLRRCWLTLEKYVLRGALHRTAPVAVRRVYTLFCRGGGLGAVRH